MFVVFTENGRLSNYRIAIFYGGIHTILGTCIINKKRDLYIYIYINIRYIYNFRVISFMIILYVNANLHAIFG